MLLSSFRGRTMTTRWHCPAPTEQGRTLDVSELQVVFGELTPVSEPLYAVA